MTQTTSSLLCYDAGSSVGDRYTVVFAREYRNGRQFWPYLAMSADPFYPTGIGMSGELNRPPAGSYGRSHLGARIPFELLPPDCQKLAIQTLKE